MIYRDPTFSKNIFKLKKNKHIPYPLEEKILFFGYARVALLEGLKLLSLRPGDSVMIPEYICDVIMPSFANLGLKVKFYSLDANLNPAWGSLENIVEDNTRALLVVNYFGFASDLITARKFCDAHKIYLIEDNSHGFLSSNDGRALGSFGDISIFSFRKTIPIPNGAALLINNRSLDEKLGHCAEGALEQENSFRFILRTIFAAARSLRKSSVRYTDEVFNRTMPGELSLVKYLLKFHPLGKMIIDHLDMEMMCEQRRRAYTQWLDIFKQDPGAEKVKIVFPVLNEGVVPYVFPVLVDNRKNFIFDMREKGIESFPWPFLPQNSPEEYLSRHMVCLPVFPCFNRERLKKNYKIHSSANGAPEISRLYNRGASITFYDDRYKHGYMDAWPIEKKQRITEVIRSLKLPDEGQALDFGCGNGVLTDIIRQALPPKWKVYGTDISAVAVNSAKSNYPLCGFFAADDMAYTDKKFDFLFTHHVLEHVYNIEHVLTEIKGFLKTESAMLHILPCGNEGSFEHDICLLRKNGIDPKLENRFFFEDDGHVRRMTTEQLGKLCAKNGFILENEYYGNQYYGAIDWITQSGTNFINMFLDASKTPDEKARSRVRKLRCALLVFCVLRYPSTFIDTRLRKKNLALRDYMFLLICAPFYPFSKIVDVYFKNKAFKEWQARKTECNGSEMYLFFKR